jgi:signal transduction histidine kinase
LIASIFIIGRGYFIYGKMVEDVLNLSRIESGRLEYRIEPAHIEDALNELYAIFRVATKQKEMYG